MIFSYKISSSLCLCGKYKGAGFRRQFNFVSPAPAPQLCLFPTQKSAGKSVSTSWFLVILYPVLAYFRFASGAKNLDVKPIPAQFQRSVIGSAVKVKTIVTVLGTGTSSQKFCSVYFLLP
jgi:hypothetical protein